MDGLEDGGQPALNGRVAHSFCEALKDGQVVALPPTLRSCTLDEAVQRIAEWLHELHIMPISDAEVSG